MIVAILVSFAVGAATVACAMLYAAEKDKAVAPSDEQCVAVWKAVNGTEPSELVRQTAVDKARAWYTAWRDVEPEAKDGNW